MGKEQMQNLSSEIGLGYTGQHLLRYRNRLPCEIISRFEFSLDSSVLIIVRNARNLSDVICFINAVCAICGWV